MIASLAQGNLGCPMGRHARALQQTLHRRRHARSRRSLKIREYRNPSHRQRRRASRYCRVSPCMA